LAHSVFPYIVLIINNFLELCLVFTPETNSIASDGDHLRKPAVRDVLIF
jgi:hypothetical protein